MRRTWFKIFMGLFVLIFAGLWVAGGVAEARSKQREHHRHHYPYSVEVGDVVAVASGGSHTVELKADGTVWAWGKNELGQLGDGTTIDSPAPIQVSGLTDITAIAGGDSHTIALKADGTVWAWGDNKYGQLGVTTPETCVNDPYPYSPYYYYSCSTTPIQISGLTDVIAIAAGDKHTIALKADGTVWVWGYNGYGQLGTETIETCETWSLVMGELYPWDAPCSTTPIQISGLTDVSAVAAGAYHTMALKTDGTVWSWGDNKHGQLGDGTKDRSYTPVQVNSLTDIAAITGGGDHTIALTTDGTVWAWGENSVGQLGDGTTTDSSTPVQVSGLTDVTAIAAGGTSRKYNFFKYGHTIALKADGTVWAWGDNEHGQLGVTTTEICEVRFGTTRSTAASLYTFCSTTPIQVSGLTDVSAIAAGFRHTIALKSNGTAWAWGDNEYGQLGVITTETCGNENDFDCSPTPVPVRSKATGTFSVGGTVSSLTGTLVLQNNGGDDLTITDNGPFSFATELEDLAIYDITVLSQPFDQTCSVISGRVNAADVIDIEIKCFTFADIAAGYAFSIALESDGTVWEWGTTTDSTTLVQVSDLTDVTAITAGFRHTLALKTDGTVWAWGRNNYGQLGDGTTIDSTTPVQVSGLTDVIAIDGAGDSQLSHTVALKTDGTVWVWGYNGAGQLGVTTTETCSYSAPCSSIPLQVSGLMEVTDISGGGRHTTALKADGTVWAWGWNGFGQLGDGTTIDSTTPVQVSGLTDVIAIAAGTYNTLALKTDGTVWAWGWNEYGQLGDGTTIDSPTPVQVNGLTDVTAIAASGFHSIALKADGTVWAWGDNRSGQLGDGTTDGSTTPVQISGLTDVTAITAGYTHTIVLESDGTLWAWGNNVFGQLGNVTINTFTSTPVQVITP